MQATQAGLVRPPGTAYHVPVLLAEVVEQFRGVEHPRVVVDGTVGLGGHAEALIKERGKEIELYVAIDRDAKALEIARERLQGLGTPVLFHQGNYTSLRSVMEEEELPGADFILLDLGVSTMQLKTPERGFSFMAPGPLDMRMDTKRGATAFEMLERATPAELEHWLREYGEVRQPGRMARGLYEKRSHLRTTTGLANAVLEVLHLRKAPPHEIHPATLVFQALRIAVNRELESLDEILPVAIDELEPGGRLAVISFHSLEDRRVKQAFELASRDCICPPRMPACGCGHQATVELLHRGAIQPSEAEIAANPPSRSARLRAVEKLP